MSVTKVHRAGCPHSSLGKTESLGRPPPEQRSVRGREAVLTAHTMALKKGSLVRKDRADVGSATTVSDVDRNGQARPVFIHKNKVLKECIWAFLTTGKDMT